MGVDYIYLKQITDTGRRLQLLGADYIYWEQISDTGSRLHLLGVDYRYWEQITSTGSRLHLVYAGFPSAERNIPPSWELLQVEEKSTMSVEREQGYHQGGEV